MPSAAFYLDGHRESGPLIRRAGGKGVRNPFAGAAASGLNKACFPMRGEKIASVRAQDRNRRPGQAGQNRHAKQILNRSDPAPVPASGQLRTVLDNSMTRLETMTQSPAVRHFRPNF